MTINELVNKVKYFQQNKEFPISVELGNSEYLMFKNALLIEEVSELLNAITNKDIVGVADGIADAIYILIGIAMMLDIPIDEVLEEVHRSNMSKDKGAVKGQNYEPPRIKEILKRNRK